MNVFLISAGNIEYDGRLRELIKVAQLLGTTHYITCSYNNKKIGQFHHVFKYDKKFAYISFIRFCLKTANEIGDIDVVIADNRKAIIPALWIKRIHNVKVAIQDARELYIFNEVKSIQGKIGCLIESTLNKKFDITICANKYRSRIMKEHYHLKTNPIVFENIRRLEYEEGFNREYYDKKYKEIFKNKKWRIVSTAGCSIERGTLDFVNAVGNLDSEHELYLIGDYQKKDFEILISTIEEKKYKNIYIFNAMEQNELKYFISHCDIGIVNYHQKDMNNKFCASGKIYEFIYESLPVMTTTNPPLKELCDIYKIGISTNDYQKGIKEITKNYENYKKQVSEFIVDVSTESNNKKLAGNIQKYLSPYDL